MKEWLIKKLYYSLPAYKQLRIRGKLREPRIDEIFIDARGELFK